MASSCRNSSTPVLPLGTPFNTISHFSDQIAYPPNVLWRSRWIHQRGHLSLRSLSSTIQPAQTVLPVPGPSIVSADNDPNWEDAPTNPSTNNNIANRPMSSTRSRSKPCWSDNTNEQLAKVLSRLANTLNTNQTPGLILIQGELKPASPTLSVALSPTSSIISCFNAGYISALIRHNSTWTLQKSTSQWPILLE